MKNNIEKETTVFNPDLLLTKVINKHLKKPLFPKSLTYFKDNLAIYEQVVKK